MIKTKFNINQEVWVATAVGPNIFQRRQGRGCTTIRGRLYEPKPRTIRSIQLNTGIDSEDIPFRSEYYDVKKEKRYHSRAGYMVHHDKIFDATPDGYAQCMDECYKCNKPYRKIYTLLNDNQRKAVDAGDRKWYEIK